VEVVICIEAGMAVKYLPDIAIKMAMECIVLKAIAEHVWHTLIVVNKGLIK
jgi:hypothetical protein